LARLTQSIVREKLRPEILAASGSSAEERHLAEIKRSVGDEPSAGLQTVEAYPFNLNC
jgi:hypothetical protein